MKTVARPQLIILNGVSSLDTQLLEVLSGVFTLHDATDVTEAQQLMKEHPGSLVLGPSGEFIALERQMLANDAAVVLHHLGEGVALVNRDGAVIWRNARFASEDDTTRSRFISACQTALQSFNASPQLSIPVAHRATQKFVFDSNHKIFEVVISAASSDMDDESLVASVVGVLCDITAGRALQQRIDAIDSAGAKLMRIDASLIKSLNAAERLKLLEDRIVGNVHDLLHFDNFEIRLLDPETNRMEVVISVGISSERIGEVLYAQESGNGICGYVAATGQPYLCPNVKEDALYREGLDNAASSLTVPLRVHDRVIGVFNIESHKPNAFDLNDQQFAEIFARYVAMALDLLNLLLVERHTTNEQIATTVLDELDVPLRNISRVAEKLKSQDATKESMQACVEKILKSVESVRSRVRNCSAGPRSVLAAEQELHRHETDPHMEGKVVLIADDEPTIRETVGAILDQRGCEVTVCSTGQEMLDSIHRFHDARRQPDLLISDIKLPDVNGYQVFSVAKELFPDTPVILMTGFGYDPHHSIVRASQEGLHCFLFKPFKAAQLISEVQKAFVGSNDESKK